MTASPETDWFPWSDAFATGIPKIDREHRLIFKHLSRLAMADLNGHRSTKELVSRVLRTVRSHLKSELLLWEASLGEHPCVKHHAAQHDVLRDRLAADLREAHDYGDAGTGVLVDLVKWQAEHILCEDLRMARAVRLVRKGLNPADAYDKAAAEETTQHSAMTASLLTLLGSSLSNTLTAASARRDQLLAKQSAAEQEFQALFENAGAGIATHELILDSAGRPVDYVFLSANPAFAQLTALPLEKVIGRHASELQPEIAEAPFLEIFGRVVRTGNPESFVNFSKSLGRHYVCNAFRLRANQFAVIFEDVTGPIEAEQQAHLFRRAFDLSASAIAIVDAVAEDYPILYTNAAFSRLTGYSAAECAGKNCRFLHLSDCDQPDLKNIRKALHDGTSMRANLRNYRKDGTLFWNHLAIAPLHDKDNKLTHYVGIQTDVTKIKKLEARALQERDLAEKREAILKQAQLLAKAGHWEFVAASNTLTWSDEVYTIFGLDPQSFPATYEGFLATVHPDDLEAVKAAFDTHLITRKPYFIQHRIVLPDGSIKHVQERCETTFDEDGSPLRSLGVVLDITEAYEQEQEFRRLFEGMAQGVVYQDAAGAITQANPAAMRLLGLEYEQLTGRTSTDPEWRAIREDGSEFPGDEHPAMLALRTGRTVADVVMGVYHPRRDDTVWILINSQPEFRAGQDRPWRVSTTFTDISQVKAMEKELRNQQEVLEMQVAQRTALLREQEQLYRGLIESQQDLIVRADRDDCFTFVNDAYCRFFGKTREELIGQPFAPYIHEEDLGLTLEAIMQLEQPPHRVSIEHRAPIGDGFRWIAWEGCAIWDELGRFREFQAVGRDVTESKAAQQAAESASRAKTEFLAKMSHEIRTPLNAIIGFARILERELSRSSRHAGHVRTILQSSEHLIAMANDLLDAGKIESGKIVLSVETFDLQALLREMADIFRIRAAEKGVHFLFDPASNLPSAIISDHTKLRQIIYNLLENAVKFTDAGRVVLRAAIAASEGGGGSNPVLSIEIEDSGCGISGEDLPCLFDDFFQGDTGRSFGGTGLGLPICQKLLHLMGGDIRVESEHGVGTLVRCTIPFLAVQGEANGRVSPRLQPSRDVSRTGGGLRTPPLRSDIAELPQELREAMRRAVDDGNMGAMRDIIEQLRDSHPSLAHGLRVLADRYDYEAFEKIL